MDKLERYLDQVCRSIGGPRALRQHVRQELREHLLDAVARHQAAGLSAEDAADRALEEFGKPEDVRSELEAAHGQRVLGVVIERALQWKEMTMRAKWLWTTWAYLGLVGVVALEVLFLTFLVIMIVPKFLKLMQDGFIDYGIIEDHGVTWMPSFLASLGGLLDRWTTILVLGAAALWGLFEWRVRSENKTFMRLAAMGTVAVALMVVLILTVGAMVISFTLAMPAMGRMARPFALEQVAAIESSLGAIEQARAKKDWAAQREPAEQLLIALGRLGHGPALTSMSARNERPTLDELRADVKSAQVTARKLPTAIAAQDERAVDAALAELRRTFEPVREASKRPLP